MIWPTMWTSCWEDKIFETNYLALIAETGHTNANEILGEVTEDHIDINLAIISTAALPNFFREKSPRCSEISKIQQQEINNTLVSTFNCTPVLINTPDNFVAGKISENFTNWTKLTSDKWILKNAKATKLNLTSTQDSQYTPVPYDLGMKKRHS